jgi:hypothetical protein
MPDNIITISPQDAQRRYAELLEGTRFTCAQDIRERQYRGIWAPEEDDLLWELSALEGSVGIPDSRILDD